MFVRTGPVFGVTLDNGPAMAQFGRKGSSYAQYNTIQYNFIAQRMRGKGMCRVAVHTHVDTFSF